MKKILFAIIFLGLFSTRSSAQIGFGLRGGYGGCASSQELVNGMTREIATAPTFGFMFNYDLDLHFASGFEVNYTTFSEIITYSKDFSPAEMRPVDLREPVTTKSTINYLQIPLFGRATFGEKKNKLFISFGPYLGIGLSGKRENGMPKEEPSRFLNASYDAKFEAGDFARYDVGGQLGGGAQRSIGTGGKLFIEARFQIGFFDFYSDMTKIQRESYLGSNAQRNGYFTPGATWRALNISVGYFHTFKLPKKSTNNSVKKAGKQKRS